MIEDLRKEQIEYIRARRLEARKKRRKRLLIFIPLIIILLLAVFLVIQTMANRNFETTYYNLSSPKVSEPVRLAVLSDLHSVEYGENNSELIDAISNEQPDLILMLGDMINMDDTDFSGLRQLCAALKDIAPVYFTLGNHEGSLMYSRLDSVPLDSMLMEAGVNVLINQTADWQKGDTVCRIAGISIDASGYDKWAREKLESFWSMDGYKIVISHFPNLYYSKLRDADFDLALAGHYHGGLVQIPGVGGLYHPETGFFPEYSGGQYELTNGTLIVSRGIGSHGLIPRINNLPELVIVEISPELQEG